MGERINVSYSELFLDFTVIATTFARLRKVENNGKSYWNNTLGPIGCCFFGRFGYSDDTFDKDEGSISFLLSNVKLIDWDKEKGRMTIESRTGEGRPKFGMTVGLKQISPL